VCAARFKPNLHSIEVSGGPLIILAQVCPRYYPYMGGVETHVREISERLAKKGFIVEVLTTDPSGKLLKEDIINSVKVRRFKSWAPNENYHFSKELKKYLVRNSNNYDIVHAHSYHDFPALYAAQVKNRNKLVFTPHYHGTGHTLFRSLLHIPYKFLGKKIFENADKIVCVSNFERSLVLRNFKVDEKKVALIPNGLNLEEFKGFKKRVENCRIILCVGRLERYKGVHYLIEALPKLDDDIVLEIVGKGSFKEHLVKLAKKLKVENRVRFFQDLPRNELLQRYVDASLFVLLSRHEAYGICVAEALASKTPCIVANESALSEWVDGKSCFGVKYPINIDDLAELIHRLMNKSVEIVKLPTWDNVVDRLGSLYNEN